MGIAAGRHDDSSRRESILSLDINKDRNLFDYTEKAMEKWSWEKIKARYTKMPPWPNENVKYKLKSRIENRPHDDIICVKYRFGPQMSHRTTVDYECINKHWQYDYFDARTGEYLASDLEAAKRKLFHNLQKWYPIESINKLIYYININCVLNEKRLEM